MAQDDTNNTGSTDSAQQSQPSPKEQPVDTPKSQQSEKKTKTSKRKSDSARDTVTQPWPGMDRSKFVAVPKVMTEKERKAQARERVNKIIKARPTKAQVKVKGHVYKISNVHKEGDMLCCTVEGYGITDNDYRFVNPPVNVPDGTTTKKYDETGKLIDLPNFKEDPRAAFLQIVADAIETTV